MKIAINCIFCQPKGGGIKEYIVNLTNNIESIDNQNEYILYVLEDQLDYARSVLPSRFRLKTVPFKSDFLSIIKRSLFSHYFWLKEEAAEHIDIFHSPFFYAPKMKKAKLIITVHDLRLYRFPNTYGKLRYLYLQHAVKESLLRADRIISISNFTKKEIIDTCKIPSARIIVIHEAINRNSFSKEDINDYILPEEFSFLNKGRLIFSLGHIEPRKNYKRLIEAFKLLKKNKCNADVKLVIAGKPNVDAESVISLINKTQDVIYLNFIPRKLLLWIYKNAELFVFPSFYEGFGFPPLEAASLGTVSVVSSVSSIPEVCGDCAFYFNPYDIIDMAEKIDIAINNDELRKKKKALLEQQLDKFSWKENARETIEVYHSLSHL